MGGDAGLLLGTLPLLPHEQAGMAVQMPLEERGGEAPLQEEAPAKLRRCAAAPVKSAEKAPRRWCWPASGCAPSELVPATPAMPGVRPTAAGRSGHALGRCARAPPATRPGAAARLIHGPA